MSPTYDVALIVGSLRRDSLNRKLANALIGVAPPALRFAPLEIGTLPLYNADLETESAPAPWVEFRNRILASDAIVFVTPEYNRSIPGGLKNAIDVGSRPRGKSAWSGKPAGVISLTPGSFGAMASNLQLRSVLGAINVPTMPGETYLGDAEDLFDAAGRLTAERTQAFLVKFAASFEAWVAKFVASTKPSGV